MAQYDGISYLLRNTHLTSDFGMTMKDKLVPRADCIQHYATANLIVFVLCSGHFHLNDEAVKLKLLPARAFDGEQFAYYSCVKLKCLPLPR